MKRILITGGSGFIGSNITAFLREEYAVFAPTHQELDFIDTTSCISYVKKHKIHAIIHCATVVGVHYFEPTILMFKTVLELSKRVESVLYFGTGAEYGKYQDLNNISESAFGDRIPDDPNGLSKYINSLLAMSTGNITIFRLFGVYGPGEDYTKKYISNAIVKHLFGLAITIAQDAIFHYLYVDDLCRLVREFLSRTTLPRVMNVTPDESIRLTKIASIINTVGKRTVPIIIKNACDNFQYTGSNALLRSVLPTYTFLSYKQGIERLYDYYQSKLDMLDKKSILSDAYLRQAVVRK